MGDGKALQMGTSHELGQNFARAFGIDYLAASGQRELVWTTSWGITTRLIGGIVMAHGDDLGLRVPPRLAPIQVEVLVVRDGDGVAEVAHKLTTALLGAGVRATLNERVDVPSAAARSMPSSRATRSALKSARAISRKTGS